MESLVLALSYFIASFLLFDQFQANIFTNVLTYFPKSLAREAWGGSWGEEWGRVVASNISWCTIFSPGSRDRYYFNIE